MATTKEKNKLIPKLRFPEFRDDGEWVEKKLGDCLDRKPEYGINAPAVPYSDKLPTYLRITDISEDGKFLPKGKVSVDSDVNTENYLSNGDIVLARTGASVGKSYKYRSEDGKLVFAGFLIRVKPNKKELDSEFLFQFLSTVQYWKWVSFVSARSGQPGINGTEYSSMPISIPLKLKEQQKIASCLSSLDELIEAHRQKLELLKRHKKGLMQNLFPQEGEKVPKLRFPEFRDDGEWVEKCFEQLFEIGNGRDYKHLSNGNIPVYGSGGYMISVDGYLYDGESVCIGRKGTIDRPMFLVGKFWTVDTLFYTHSFKDCIPKFIYFVFQNINWLNYNEAGGVPSLSKRNLYKIEVSIPKIKEQQKIASCLSSLDELIAAQENKIEQLKKHKKGLMQGLFPEVEG